MLGACASHDPGTTEPPQVCNWHVMPKNSGVMVLGRSDAVIAALASDVSGQGAPPVPPAQSELKVQWTSSDESVIRLKPLSIKAVTATAVKAGSATLTATACLESVPVSVTVIPAGYRVTFVGPYNAVALNDSGWVVASGAANILRTASGLVDLGACVPVDINNRGDVLCQGSGPKIWSDGSITVLDTISTSPIAINDARHFLIPRGNGMLWRSPTDITAPCPNFVFRAVGLNGRDDVIGNDRASLYMSPVICQTGQRKTVGYWARWGDAKGVSDAGDVAVTGECAPARPGTIALIDRANAGWAAEPLRGPNPVGLCNDLASDAVDVNTAKQVIGTGSDGPFLWANGSLALLNRVLADTNWRINGVNKINNRGQILGYATNTATLESGTVLIDPP